MDARLPFAGVCQQLLIKTSLYCTCADRMSLCLHSLSLFGFLTATILLIQVVGFVTFTVTVTPMVSSSSILVLSSPLPGIGTHLRFS